MKAITILLGLVAVAAAALAAQPVHPAAVVSVTTYATEPVWMILCGASLLAIASVVRRYLP
jgi:cytochrome c biogenesis factor